MTAKKQTYHELKQELDTILDDIRSGSLSIDQAAKAYEQAMSIVKKLDAYLDTVEATISKITPKAS